MELAPYAMDVARSAGRRFPEPPHRYRNDYARDRGRVTHCRAFRRLEAKTQVFTTRFSDHFRDRLTHTLEVAQIARTVAGALKLNTDLAETLALVHDIGHPPFGHAGEHRMDELLRPFGGRFDHNLHALRIVESFEQSYPAFPGLNLTFEVREGIVKHSREYSAAAFPELAEYRLAARPPLEAQIIDLVDEIAYNIADLDDGFEARLLDLDMLRAELPVFAESHQAVERMYPSARTRPKFSEAIKQILDGLAMDLIETTRALAAAQGAQSAEDIRNAPGRLAAFSGEWAAVSASLKDFLLRRLYNHPAIVDERERSVEALEQVFRFYLDHPQAMPAYFSLLAERAPRHRVVCDYVAGMTDDFLLRQHGELMRYGPAATGR